MNTPERRFAQRRTGDYEVPDWFWASMSEEEKYDGCPERRTGQERRKEV